MPPPRPKRNSAASSPNSSSELLTHIERFGITTADVVARLFCAGSERRARTALADLVHRRELVCRSDFYARHARLLNPRSLHAAYALLWYCCVRKPHCQLLSPARLEQLTAFAVQYGLAAARNAHCYVDRDRKRLCLIRPWVAAADGSPLPVERVLVRLQRFVLQPTFRLWAYFATNRGFQIIALVSGEATASELTLWVRRRPLYCALLEPPVPIPVRIVAAPAPALPKR